MGPEQSGLTNDDLARCQQLLHIPTNPEFGSLNLAMAVQLVAYELFRARGVTIEPRPNLTPLASPGDMSDTDTIHTSGAIVTTAAPSSSPLTTRPASADVTRGAAIGRHH